MNEVTPTEKPLVLMTGSKGLIGRRVVEGLEGPYRVVGMDIVDPGAARDAYIQCDLTDDISVGLALDQVRERFGSRLAAVVHLAAYYDFSGKPSPLYRELTVNGTKRLVEGLRSFDVGVLVFSSSLLVMKPVNEVDEEQGDEEPAPLTETSDTRAEWAYPRSKLEAETLLRFEHHLPVAVLRIAGVYDERCHSLPISHHIQRIFEKKLESYVFPGDVANGQPFIHLDDVATAIRSAVDRRDRLNRFRVYLIAEPEVLSHQDLQHRLGDLIHGSEWPTISVPKPLAKLGAGIKDRLTEEEQFIKPWMVELADDHYPVEIRKAQDELDWRPRHRLSDTLPAMIAFLKQDPQGFYEENNLPVPDDLEALCQKV